MALTAGETSDSSSGTVGILLFDLFFEMIISFNFSFVETQSIINDCQDKSWQ